MTVCFNSPAKLNLFLQVTGKTEKGYHTLHSFFHTIDLFDYITFEERELFSFTTNHETLPVDETNLVVKAYHLFRQHQKDLPHFALHLEKNIPLEGGLGGGSGNAATVLWALNHFSEEKLDQELLLKIGEQLGADVPFFLSEGASLVEGIGEIICPKPPLSGKPFTLFYPSFGLSTKTVFSSFLIEEREEKRVFDPSAPFFYNSLEKAAFRVCPSLEKWKGSIEEKIGVPLCMTGTGSTFFAEGHFDLPIPSKKIRLISRVTNSWYLQ